MAGRGDRPGLVSRASRPAFSSRLIAGYSVLSATGPHVPGQRGDAFAQFVAVQRGVVEETEDRELEHARILPHRRCTSLLVIHRCRCMLRQARDRTEESIDKQGRATVRQAGSTRRGSLIRWTEAAGDGPPRVYVHGLGAASAAYHAHIAARPELAGRRTLFVDLPGHGLSDRPADFGYSLEDHAAALAAALDAAGVRGAEIVGHSMGGSVAIVLAHRRPDLVSRLVVTEANLDPTPPAKAGSSGIATTARRSSSTAAASRACWSGSALLGGDHAAGGPARPAPQRGGSVPRYAAHDAPDADGAARRAHLSAGRAAAVNSPGHDELGPRACGW